LYNGQWIEPDTYQVVVGLWNCTEILNGIADFNKQLEVLVPKPGRGAITNPHKLLIKPMFSRRHLCHQ
jgi:lipoprotein-releasing system permease protein